MVLHSQNSACTGPRLVLQYRKLFMNGLKEVLCDWVFL